MPAVNALLVTPEIWDPRKNACVCEREGRGARERERERKRGRETDRDRDRDREREREREREVDLARARETPAAGTTRGVQGYLAHKKQLTPRTLQ